MASGSFSNAWNGFTYVVNWSSSVNTTNNTSTVVCSHYLVLNSGWRLAISGRTNTCTVAGVSQAFTSGAFDQTGGTVALGTTSYTVAHNSAGAGSFSLSSAFNVNASIGGYGYCGAITVSGTGTLDTINRSPSTVSAPAGTIGSTVKISIKRASTNFHHKLTYKFGSLSATIATGVGTSYTWTIPTGFYKEIPNAKYGTCKITCETFYGTTSLGSKSVSIRVSIDEEKCRPTLSPTVKDINSTSIAITQSEDILILNLSNAQVNANPTFKNYATLRSIKITCGNDILKTTSGVFNQIEDSLFTFSVVDSRGLTAETTVFASSYDYVHLTCNFTGGIPTINGTFSFDVTGNFYNGRFGNTMTNANTLTLEHRIKVDGGSYGSWMTIPVERITYDGNTYAANMKMIGLDTTKGYTFQVRATDRVKTVTAKEYYVKYSPVFDWGKGDFSINVPASVDGDLSVNGNVNIKGTPIGRDIYTGIDECFTSTKFSANGSHTVQIYHFKPFNMMYLRLYVSGWSEAIPANSSTYQTIAALDSTRFKPPHTTPLVVSGKPNVDVIMNASGEIKVLAREEITTGNQFYICGVFALNSGSSLFTS